MTSIDRAPLNTVLLRDPPRLAFRALTFADGSTGAAWDLSYVPFLIEDLIAHSAARIAIQDGSLVHGVVGDLPQVLRDRLIVVDKHREASEKAHAVMAPLFDEFRVRRLGRGGYQLSDEGFSEVAPQLLTLTHMLESFLVGLAHELQLELDPTEVVALSERLRKIARNSESRACLATLGGVFRTYSSVVTPSLQFRSEASDDLVQTFERFVEDETYRRLAREAGLLGIPMQMTHALIQMRRTVGDLLKRQRVSDVMTLGTKGVAVATHLPVPDPGVFARILGKPRYIPPLISLEAVGERALGAWEAADPEFRPPPGLPDHFHGVRAEPIKRHRDRDGSWP